MLDSFLGLLAHVWACVPLFAAKVAALAALDCLYVRVHATASMLEGTIDPPECLPYLDDAYLL